MLSYYKEDAYRQTLQHRTADIKCTFVITFDGDVMQRGWKLAGCSQREKVEWVKRHSYNIAHPLVNKIISRPSRG